MPTTAAMVVAGGIAYADGGTSDDDQVRIVIEDDAHSGDPATGQQVCPGQSRHMSTP
jgi:hypothetical protein